MVIWSEPARNDLKSIYNFIASNSPFYAKETIRKIVQTADRLSCSPLIGRVVPELGQTEIREVFIYSYRIIYQLLTKDKLAILAIVHGYRELPIKDIPLFQ